MQYHAQVGVLQSFAQKYTKQLVVLMAGFFVATLAATITSASAVVTTVNGCSIDDDGAGTWTLQSDCTVASRINIPADTTFDGDGNTIFASFPKNGNSDNAALGVIGADNVTIEDLTIDGAGSLAWPDGLHGINVYESMNTVIKDVNIKNMSYSGVVVNSSTASVSGVTTSGSGWHGINVDQKTAEPSVLNITGTMTQTDAWHIYSDHYGTKDITINDTLNQYSYVDNPLDPNGYTDDRLYTLKPQVPTGLHRVPKSDTGKVLACGITITRQTLYPTWDKNAEMSPYFSHYEYSSFNGGTPGIVEREFDTNQFVHNWVPPTDGTFSWQVRSVDIGGNKSPWSDKCYVTYDSEAPEQVLGMTIFQDGNNIGCDASVTKRLITVNWDDSTDPNLKHYRYQADDGVGPIDFTTTVGVSERTGSIRDKDGTYMYRVQAIDKAGNVGAWSDWCKVTLDREAPDAFLVSPADGVVLNGSSVTQSWGSVATDVAHYIYESFNDAAATSLRYTTTYNATSKTATNIADAEYWWRVTPVDEAGNVGSPTDVWKITIDNTAPGQVLGLNILGGHSAGSPIIGCGGYTNSPKVRIAWDPSSDDNIDYYWFGTKFNQKHKKVNAGTEFYNANMTPGHNPYYYTIIAVDKAGNEGPISEQCGLVLDTEAPIVGIALPSDSAVLSGAVDIEGSITDDVELSHYNLSLYPSTTDLSDGGTHSSERLNDVNWCTTPISGTVVTSADVVGSLCSGWDTTSFPDGDYQLRLAARDASGLRDTSDPYAAGTTSVHVISFTIDNNDDDVEASTVDTTYDGGSEGQVRGASTDDSFDADAKNAPEVTDAAEGSVLGASDTLASTGSVVYISIVTGVSIVALAVVVLRRRETTSQ